MPSNSAVLQSDSTAYRGRQLSIAGRAGGEGEPQPHRYLERCCPSSAKSATGTPSTTAFAMAHLPRLKTLEEFDFAQAQQISAARIRELAEGGYIERKEPIVLIGECGTGKTTWPSACAWLLAGRSGASASRRRRLWSTSWWRPSRNNQVRKLMMRLAEVRADRAGRSRIRASGGHRRGVPLSGNLGAG